MKTDTHDPTIAGSALRTPTSSQGRVIRRTRRGDGSTTAALRRMNRFSKGVGIACLFGLLAVFSEVEGLAQGEVIHIDWRPSCVGDGSRDRPYLEFAPNFLGEHRTVKFASGTYEMDWYFAYSPPAGRLEGPGRLVADSAPVRLGRVFLGGSYNVRLLSQLGSESEIPVTGYNLLIVADVNGVIHLRAFDSRSVLVLDTTEVEFPEFLDEFRELRNQIERFETTGVNPPPWEKQVIRLSVSSILAARVEFISPSVLPPPAAPTNLRATPVSNDAVRLSWDDNSSNECGFSILVKREADGSDFVISVPPNQESHTEYGLIPGSTYCFQIKSWNARVSMRIGSWEWQERVCLRLSEPPPPPPEPRGIKEIVVVNNWTKQVYIWTKDHAIGAWKEEGTLPANSSGYRNITIPLADGHVYDVRAVDTAKVFCPGNNPEDSWCDLDTIYTILGDANGCTLIFDVPDVSRVFCDEPLSLQLGRFTDLNYSPTAGFSFTFDQAQVGETYYLQSSPTGYTNSWTDFTNFIYNGPMIITDPPSVPRANKFYRAFKFSP